MSLLLGFVLIFGTWALAWRVSIPLCRFAGYSIGLWLALSLGSSGSIVAVLLADR